MTGLLTKQLFSVPIGRLFSTFAEESRFLMVIIRFSNKGTSCLVQISRVGASFVDLENTLDFD